MHSLDILSFHPGRQHNLEQAMQINRYFKRFRHFTSLYFKPSYVKKVAKLFPFMEKLLARRSMEFQNNHLIVTHILPEVNLLIKRMIGRKLKYPDFIRRNASYQKWLLKNQSPPKVCIGYDGSSWLVFESWKNRSFLILDLAVAVPEYKLALARSYNLSAELIQNHTKGDAVMYDIYRKELDLADLVLCGSEFVKKSCIVSGVAEQKLFVLPYGVDLGLFQRNEISHTRSGKIKIAFVGNVSYRKGADILLKVWRRILKEFANVELHFYGNIQIDAVPYSLPETYFHGFVSQSKLIKELHTMDISVLPTFFEGSSIAIYQSMALGLAVLTTPNAGSIITDKRNGLLIPYGDEQQLYEKLLILITDPEYRKFLSDNAVQDIKNYTWDQYGKRLSYILYENIYAPVKSRSMAETQ